MSGEAASRSSLDLPGRQQELLEAVVATGKPIILVLMNGRPLNLTWASEHVRAIYYSHNLTQSPENQGKRYWNEESTPLYPFGFGLSYSTFSFSNLKVSNPDLGLGQTIKVSVEVENTGARAGDEVTQLYIHQQVGSASRPVRDLKDSSESLLPLAKRKPFSSLSVETSCNTGVRRRGSGSSSQGHSTCG